MFYLTPFVVCTAVAIIIFILDGLEKFRWAHLLKRIFDLNIGVIAHEFVWFFGIYVLKWKMKPTIKGTWKFSLLGFLLTYIFVIVFSKPFVFEFFYLSKILAEVAAICLIVQVFLFQVGFYKRTDQFHNKQNNSDEINVETNQNSSILILKSNDKIEKIDINIVSHILVQDHYCTVYYQKENGWEQWTVYEKLKNYENQFKDFLIKINRSTLVNPNLVDKIEKSEGKYSIYMKGEPDRSINLSSSQKHLVENLIPVIS